MSIKSKIQSLITAANAKTGEADATLTDAVQTLVDGYGQGGTPVINPLSVTENGTYTAPSGVDGYSPVTVNVSGSSIKTKLITLTEELNSYNILVAMDAKLFYRYSCVYLFIFGDAPATGGANYTNNNYALFHNGTTLISARLYQIGKKVPPSNGVFATAWDDYASAGGFINSDGSFSFRSATAGVLAPVGARCLLVEIPFDNDLTLWEE